MTKVVVIMSGKGGVGKTTVSTNLGTSLSVFGRNVIALDSNFASPHLGLHLGASYVPITLHNVMKGVNHISEATYLHPCSLKIVPASVSYEELKSIDISQISQVIEDLKGYSEIILIDTPAGLSKEMKYVLSATDYSIIVTTPDIPAITEALKSIKFCNDHNVEILGIIVNKVRDEDFEMNKDNIENFLEKPVLGMIPHDHKFRESISLKNPFVHIYPEREATKEYKRIAAHLIGQEYVGKKKQDNKFKQFVEGIGLKIKFIPDTKFKK